MLKSGFSGSVLAKVTPVASGLRSSNSGGECDSRLHAVNPHTAATIQLRTRYFAGVKRMACPPPGASTTLRFVPESTVRFEMLTGSGFVAQFAPGPSA